MAVASLPGASRISADSAWRRILGSPCADVPGDLTTATTHWPPVRISLRSGPCRSQQDLPPKPPTISERLCKSKVPAPLSMLESISAFGREQKQVKAISPPSQPSCGRGSEPWTHSANSPGKHTSSKKALTQPCLDVHVEQERVANDRRTTGAISSAQSDQAQDVLARHF